MNFENFINNKEIKSNELCNLLNYFRKKEGNNIEIKHKELLRKLRNSNILKMFGLKEGVYFDSQGKKQPCYILNYTCINYLKNESRYDIKGYCYILDKMNGKETNIEILPSTYIRKELLLNQVLLALFNEEQIYSQYPVLSYRIDYYIPDYGLIIEYDESSGHKNKQKDNKRMNEILNYLIKHNQNKHYHVIRIKEFEENVGLNELFNFVYHKESQCVM